MSDIHSQQIRKLDGGLLLIFQIVLRHGRTTEAAERLGVSQSAVSHALSRLRGLFGDPLFIRRPHGLQPTRLALDLAPRIDAAILALEAALGGAPGFDPAAAARSFRIASSDFLAELLAPALLDIFRREAPQCRFAISLALGDAALRQLQHNEIDIAVGRFGRPPEQLQFTPLFRDEYCLVMRRGHPAAAVPIDRSAFEALDHVAVSVGGDYRTFTERDFAARGIVRRIVAAAPRFSIAFPMVAGSDAVCIAPRRLAAARAAVFGLALHDLPAPLRPIEVLAARRRAPDAGADWLLAALQRWAGATPPP